MKLPFTITVNSLPGGAVEALPGFKRGMPVLDAGALAMFRRSMVLTRGDAAANDSSVRALPKFDTVANRVRKPFAIVSAPAGIGKA